MFKCHTLIINRDVSSKSLEIGGLSLNVTEDGSLSTTDIDGNENIIGSDNGNAYGKIKHLEVGINNTKQVVQGNETQIFFDDDFGVNEDDDFAIGSDKNSIKILSSGHFFVSFNISLDMYNGNRSTVSGYIKIGENIIEKSMSYSYFHGKSQGYSSINNSFIYDAKENDEISFYVKRKEGTGSFYTVPLSTTFNIFRID